MVLSGGLGNSLIFIRNSIFKNILYKKSFCKFTTLKCKVNIVRSQKKYFFQYYNKNFQIIIYFLMHKKLLVLHKKKYDLHFIYNKFIDFFKFLDLEKKFIKNSIYSILSITRNINLILNKIVKLFICFSVIIRNYKFFFLPIIFKCLFNYFLSVYAKTFLFINRRCINTCYVLFLTKMKVNQNVLPVNDLGMTAVYQKLLFFYKNFYSNIFNNINFYNLYFFSTIFSEVHFNRVKWYYRFHFDIFFNSYFFTKILNVFMQDGKRAVIFQLFFKIFFFLSLATPLSILSYFLRLFYFLRLSFRLRAYTARGSSLLKPVIQRSFVVISQARLMFRKTILKRTEFSFLDKILGESIDLLFYDNSFISIFLENFVVQINNFKKNSLQFRKGKRSFFK